MRPPFLICCLAALMLPLAADEAEKLDRHPREAALETLLSERDSAEALAKAIESARQYGISDQAILEARFLFHVDRGEDEAIAAMLPEFMERRDRFRIEESEIFAVREDWLAVVEYVRALAALQAGDQEAFKKHITEAFWLSPRQGAAFAPHIEKLRLGEAMRDVNLDFASIRLVPIPGGDPAPLSAALAGRKAILLHFWSPWSPESAATIEDFQTTTRALAKHGILTATILPGPSPDAVQEAREILQTLKPQPEGLWLEDRTESPLAAELRVQDIPLMVLVSADGKVLFHGHPAEAGLWKALSALDPEIERPAQPAGDDAR